MKNRLTPFYWMTLPAVALFFVFMTLPALQGLYYSFTNWNGFGDQYDMVGFKNYINLFADENVWNAYGFTIKYSIVATIFINIISLLIALGLNAKIKYRNFFRAIYFLPNILSILIVGYIFNYLFSNVFPIWGENLGLTALSTNILGSQDLAWVGVVSVAIWQGIAFNTILYLAGLQTIPTDLYEASNLDGASKWREFWSITFPLIAPFFTINMVLAMKNSLMVFDLIVAMTNGGPGRATQSIAHLIYTGGFEGGEFAYQSANAIIYFILIAFISIIQLRFLQRRESDM
ncbi:MULTISPECIES: sugar ABC transporter permease [unclassified Paenibacillus]|uniref:Carbohydrate ABC transporter permease n=1 Tax=Paenibacillus provencensis TaxID=441151 RepID=A0ABW3PY20_9BACL|nr:MULTISPECIES: sugar ABC transporter permease [unclassified Paenibacillus]MCM3128516.1 sugar ABC transporter permease [Paenibacillus sp. MER 78]SFS78157.1 carbohydrate ABC transporter membrane protein 1, CUT1 family [Paenibacillus sp. 453mf]